LFYNTTNLTLEKKINVKLPKVPREVAMWLQIFFVSRTPQNVTVPFGY